MAMQNKRIYHIAKCLTQVAGVIAALATADAIGQVTNTDPVLPTAADGQVESGYFPTLTEDTLLRGAADSRSLGFGLSPDSVEGPDTRLQTASGLFRYYDPEPDFYQRNTDFFGPINKGLGVFTSHDAATIESKRLQNASLTVDGGLTMLTRTFNPESAHIKAGPLYFDVLWLGAGIVYSDFNGDQRITEGDSNDDGWTGYVELGVRGLVRITDSIYFSAVANLIYLPFENELGLQFGNADNSGLNFRFNYNDTLGEWEILFFDEFRAVSGLDFFVDADSPAIDRAGRYSFGFTSDRNNDLYDERRTFFINTLAFYAGRPLFDNEWRLGFGIEHSDYWRTFSFDDHSKRDWLALWMQYEGSIIPFAPRFSYEYVSNDGFNSLIHQLAIQLTGRITENISWRNKVAYGFSTGDTAERNDFLWSVALEQELTRSTRHWLGAGQDYLYNEFESDTRRSTYYRYGIDQRISSRLNASVFLQYSERESSANALFPMRDRFTSGLVLAYHPLDFTAIKGTVLYEQIDQTTTSEDASRWLYRIELNQQLSHRLTGNVFYQYEEVNDNSRPFTEHFMGVSMRRYF